MLLREVFLSPPVLSNAIYHPMRQRADCVELPSAVSCNSMQVIRDCFGHLVRLTDERLEHILEHAEMAGMDGEIERVLQAPTEVRLSRADDNVEAILRVLCANPSGWEIVVCGGKVSTR